MGFMRGITLLLRPLQCYECNQRTAAGTDVAGMLSRGGMAAVHLGDRLLAGFVSGDNIGTACI